MCEDRDKDQAYKDQDKDKDLTHQDKDFTSTAYKDLQLCLQLWSSNDNEHTQQTTVIQD